MVKHPKPLYRITARGTVLVDVRALVRAPRFRRQLEEFKAMARRAKA